MINRELGFFGKTPSLGDFVSRKLPQDFIVPWDAWLQHSITASKQQLDDRWLDVYLTSPIWRFALSPGVCGESAWYGVIIPSVDKVGRYFPFTLAYPGETNHDVLLVVAHLNDWYTQLEDLALQALDDHLVIDDYSEELSQLAFPQSIEPGNQERNVQKNALTADMLHVELNADQNGFDNIGDMGNQLINAYFPSITLWSTAGSDQVSASIVANKGLPGIERWSAFMQGNW